MNINAFLFFIAKHVYGSEVTQNVGLGIVAETPRPYVFFFICVSFFLISFIFTTFPVVVTKQMYVFYFSVSLDIANSGFNIFARACFQAICGS